MRIGHEQIHVEIIGCPHAVASRAGAVSTVKGEQTGIKLSKAQVTSGTKEFETIQMLGMPWCQDSTRPLPEVHSALHQGLDLAEALPGEAGRADDQIDVVFAVTIECRTGGESNHSAIEAHMRHADLGRLCQYLLMKTLAAAHHWRQDRHFLVSIRGAQVCQDLLGALGGNLEAALGAVLHPDLGIEQAQ